VPSRCAPPSLPPYPTISKPKPPAFSQDQLLNIPASIPYTYAQFPAGNLNTILIYWLFVRRSRWQQRLLTTGSTNQ
jgi:hypothetical protein